MCQFWFKMQQLIEQSHVVNCPGQWGSSVCAHLNKILSLFNAPEVQCCCSYERHAAELLMGVTKVPHTRDAFHRWEWWAWPRAWSARSAQPSTRPPHTLPCARPALPERERKKDMRQAFATTGAPEQTKDFIFNNLIFLWWILKAPVKIWTKVLAIKVWINM